MKLEIDLRGKLGYALMMLVSSQSGCASMKAAILDRQSS